MCGKAVQNFHFWIIGPVIIAATYFDLDWLLYLLGGATMLVHGYMLWNETNILQLGIKKARSAVAVPQRQGAKGERSILGPRSKGCSTCGLGM